MIPDYWEIEVVDALEMASTAIRGVPAPRVELEGAGPIARAKRIDSAKRRWTAAKYDAMLRATGCAPEHLMRRAYAHYGRAGIPQHCWGWFMDLSELAQDIRDGWHVVY